MSVSQTLNKAIANAIAAKQASYTVPQGSYDLDAPLVIPPGTTDFHLVGDNVALTCQTSLLAFIEVGLVGVSGNWPYSQNGAPIEAISEGAASVTLSSPGGALAVGHKYFLWDDHAEHPCTDPNVSIATHGELVTVASVSGHTATLTNGVGREYGANGSKAYVSDVTGKVCNNVAMSGFRFDGTTPSGNWVQNFVLAKLCDTISFEAMSGSNFNGGGFSLVDCTSFTIDTCYAMNAQHPSSGGYGIYLVRSRDGDVTHCKASNCQHGFIGQAILDTSFSLSSGSSAPFDLHGMDSRRISYYQCSGGLSAGNAAWKGGDRNIDVSNCDMTAGFNLGYGVKNVTFENTKLPQFAMLSGAHDGTNSAPDNIAVKGGSITANNYLIPDEPMGGDWTFDGVTFSQELTTWGSVFDWSTMTGQQTFDNCTFNFASKEAYIPIQLRGSQDVSFGGNTFVCAGPSPCAVKASATAKVNITEANTIRSTDPKAVFLEQATS